MINVGFIGLGNMGMMQVQAFAKVPGIRIAAGADMADSARQRFAEQFPNAQVYPTYQALLKNGKVDAVVVVVPTLMHKEVAIAAMKSGRPVLSEKPLARTVADARRMIDVSQKTGQLLMAAHCRRFDTDWGTLAKVIRAGTLGESVLWRHTAAGVGPGSWFMDDKLGGGPMIDGAIHNYDFANLLFGEPQSVLASSIKLTKHSAVDTATAVVRYKSGDQVMVCWSWGVTGGGMIDVLGPKGSLRWGPGDFAEDKLDTKKYGYYITTDTKGQKKKLHRFQHANMYVTQAKHFRDCLLGKTECLSPATEAIKAVAVAEAILKAAPTGSVRKVTW